METGKTYDVIIIGGSFAGLSGAMSLGRARRNVLLIDSGKPCNRQTPHAHNLITHDGEKPAAIAAKAKQQVLEYPTIEFTSDIATGAQKEGDNFTVETASGKSFTAKKLLLSTGVEDLLPETPGFAECWGISILHCPYCHGYEVKDQPLGVLANGEMGFAFAMMIYNWSQQLTLFTNGPSELTAEQAEKLHARGIGIIEKELQSIEHTAGQMQQIIFADGSQASLTALFARVPFRQHSGISASLGCELSKQGLIVVNEMQQTSVPGVYAAGDNVNMARSLAMAISAGTMAGAAINHKLVEESY